MSKEVMELTAVQSCRRLGITLDALYRLLYVGRLPGRKVEGTWRIPAKAIAERAKQKRERERRPSSVTSETQRAEEL